MSTAEAGTKEIVALLYNGVRMDNGHIVVEWEDHSITSVTIFRVRQKSRRVRSGRSPDGRRGPNTYTKTEKVKERVENPSFYPGQKKEARQKITELDQQLAEAADRAPAPEDVIPEWLL